MKILIVTGELASPTVKKVVSDSEKEVEVFIADIPIAAFLTPRRIVNELKKSDIDLSSIDTILIPGLIPKDAKEISDKLAIPTFKGPTDASDLPIVIDLIDKLELSTLKAADKLIEEEQRKRALKIIKDFESDEEKTKKLLEKDENILIANLAVGEDFPMRVLAEIANVPMLSDEELTKKAEYFIKSGADMIDIGLVAGEDYSKEIPHYIEVLRKVTGDRPLSIDTLNPKEIKVAIEHDIDLVLSLDLGNCEELLPLLEEKNIPAVLLPTNFSVNKVPHTVEDRVENMKGLTELCSNIDYLPDLILDPINSISITDSFNAFLEFHKINKAPMFFGVGNVVELLDTDSTGANAVLAGIGMEIGASVLFTPEESGKTRGSVYELAVASKMMFLAKKRASIPKDLGIRLLMFKDKNKKIDMDELIEPLDDVEFVETENSLKFVFDKSGSFKIVVKDDHLEVIHFIKREPNLVICGKTAREIYEEIISRNLISRLEHASYLGAELQKAEIAMLTGKNYMQDEPLFIKNDLIKEFREDI